MGHAIEGGTVPEVGDAIEGGLCVEDVSAVVHDDRAVHKVLHPVGPSSLVQSQVPVCPAHHIVVQVLQQMRGEREEESDSFTV